MPYRSMRWSGLCFDVIEGLAGRLGMVIMPWLWLNLNEDVAMCDIGP